MITPSILSWWKWGAYRRGEIAEICQLTRPSVALLIDIGPQHLERFGSIAETKRAKFELVEALPEDGLAVYNWDSTVLREEFAKPTTPPTTHCRQPDGECSAHSPPDRYQCKRDSHRARLLHP